LPDEASDLFLRAGLDRFLVICPSGYFVADDADIYSLQALATQELNRGP
jgi:hypothetical protein